MSFHDPEYKQRGYVGFYDPDDVESLIRAIKEDAASRLFNAHEVRIGKQNAETAQTNRDVHNAILMRHMYVHPFVNVEELRQFVRDWPGDAPIDNLMRFWVGVD